MRPTYQLESTTKDGELDVLIFKNRIAYYKGDNLHREDGPALVFTKGLMTPWIYEEKWYFEGKLHRGNNLPATTSFDGTYRTYYKHGIPHRLTGPAIENLSDPSKNMYIIDGQEYDYKDFLIKSRKMKIRNLS